jgi:hypothetical protein
LTASLTCVLSLKLSNTVRHVNRPPLTFKQTDEVTEVALVATFWDLAPRRFLLLSRRGRG